MGLQRAALLERDLQIEEMSLEAAERKLQEYADKNHGSARAFCITPIIAEKILREFYGLPAHDDGGEEQTTPEENKYIDLSSFL